MPDCKKCGGAIPYGTYGNVKCEYCNTVNYVPLPQEEQRREASEKIVIVEKKGSGLKILGILLTIGLLSIVGVSIYTSTTSSHTYSNPSYLTSPPATTVAPTTAPPPTTLPPATKPCLTSKCHDLDQTKSFHLMENIKMLEESRGENPRICTTCHGSLQHEVHQNKLSNGEIVCDTCHVSAKGDYMVAIVPEGKLLVCEACHAFSGKPEDVGNYISIHILEGNRECDICHGGDPHKLSRLGPEE